MLQVDHTHNIIEIQHVSFAYDSKAVLQDISLNVHLGDYLGLVGPNGAGKTTLLKIILGLLPNYSGTVKIFGHDIKQNRVSSQIGYVPQKAAHFDSAFPATVAEVVAMGRFGQAGLFRFLGPTDRQKIDQAIEQVGMTQFKQTLIGNLSGGQQQRVLIARALAAEPRIIILDEPTVGVDAEAQQAFYALLKKLNQTLQLTLMLVSHDIDVVATETTEVACINGSLTYHGSPADFIKANQLSQLYGAGFKVIAHNH